MPRWEKCWSPYNLTSFLTWMRHYASEEEKAEVMHLYTVEHRKSVPAWLAARGIIPQEVPLQVTIGGVQVDFPKNPCDERGCERCRSGRGGYQFRWVDPRWTPQAALDLSLSPQQVQTEMYKPWPRGLLPIPKGSRDHDSTVPAGAIQPTSSSRTSGDPEAWVLRAMPEPAQESAASSSIDPALPVAAARSTAHLQFEGFASLPCASAMGPEIWQDTAQDEAPGFTAPAEHETARRPRRA